MSERKIDPKNKYDAIIVGGGQSGLAMAYYLKKLKRNFIIIDASPEIGYSWKNRWKSLKLFTPSEYNHLPGYKLDKPKGYYPSKDEVAEYLNKYANHFNFQVLLNQEVKKITKTSNKFEVYTKNREFICHELFLAIGSFHSPYIPPFSNLINSEIKQLHTSNYKHPEDVKGNRVCIVGAGDSGVQIAEELAHKNYEVKLSSSDAKISSIPQEFLGKTLWWWFNVTGVINTSVNTRLGKYLKSKKQPVIGTNVKALVKRNNVHQVNRIESVNPNGEIKTIDGKTIDVDTIIWATGYKANFSLIDFKIDQDAQNLPITRQGICDIENLYFIGLPWMHTRGSATLGGVKKDAKSLYNFLKRKNIVTT